MEKENDILFEEIISIENLLLAWSEFVIGKRHKKDVQMFQLDLMTNFFTLHGELANYTYQHGNYQAFKIFDPKPRNIHKAKVRDRVLHHAIYRILYPYFDVKFINDSFSCRLEKSVHKALRRFRKFGQKASLNNIQIGWILKGDVKKCFASVDQEILKNILQKYLTDEKVVCLLDKIIKSFNSGLIGKGLPLGNLTSQLLINIYLNDLDQFVKHKLKVKYYLRYADDFVILHNNKKYLDNLLPQVDNFLLNNLKLEIHGKKCFVKTLTSGIDFLGWTNFFKHRVLRTLTKKRMFKRLAVVKNNTQTLNSYLGLLKHGNTEKIRQKILTLSL